MASIRDIGYRDVKVGGTRRAAPIDASGPFTKDNTLSYAQAQKLAGVGRHKEQGISGGGGGGETKEYKLRSLDPQRQSMVRDYLKTKRDQGIIMSERDARKSKEFQDIVRALKYKGKSARSNASTSRKAKALIALGRRHPEDDWSVGETPTEGEVAA